MSQCQLEYLVKAAAGLQMVLCSYLLYPRSCSGCFQCGQFIHRITQGSLEKWNQQDMCIFMREIYFKALSHSVVEVCWVQNLIGGTGRLETQKRVVSESKGSLLSRLSFGSGKDSLYSIKAFDDWLRHTHIRENLLYSESTDSNVIFPKKHPE